MQLVERALVAPRDLVAAALPAAERALARRFVLLGILASVVVVRWVTTAIVAHIAAHNGWLYYNGGDGVTYWTTSWSLGHLHTPIGILGYGLGLIQAPFARIAGPAMMAGLPGVIFFNAAVFAPLGVIALYLLGRRLGNRLFGVAAAALWVVLPFLALLYFRQSYHAVYINLFLSNLMGLTTTADMPSAVLVAWTAVLTLRAADEGSLASAALAGVVAGFAIGMKPANALFLPAAAVCLLLWRRVVGLGIFGAALLPALAALAIWRDRGNGTLSAMGRPTHEAAGPLLAIGNLSWHFWSKFDYQLLELREVGWSLRIVEWLVVAGLIGALRRSPRLGIVLAVWIFCFVVLKGSVGTVYGTSFFRLTLPGLPAVILAMLSTVFLIPGARGRAEPTAVRRTGWRLVGVVGIVFALAPLAIVAAAPKQSPTLDAFDIPSNVLMPISPHWTLGARIKRHRLELSWSAPYRGSTRVSYLIVRSSYDTKACAVSYPNQPGCVLTGDTVVGSTRTTHFAAYLPSYSFLAFRVVLYAGYNARHADPLLLSGPVVVKGPRP